jgi:curved DNA-binding protein
MPPSEARPTTSRLMEQRDVWIAVTGDQRRFPAMLMDASADGFALELDTALPVGAAVTITGDSGTGHNRRNLRTEARVSWCESVGGTVFMAGLKLARANSINPFLISEAPPSDSGDGDIDYYDVLQVSSKADPETIQRVYRLLAQRYHPDNPDTGKLEIFRQVTDAYRVLSDPQRRAAYDLQHRLQERSRWRIFESPEAASGPEAELRKRQAILSALYDKRIQSPIQPGLSIQELEDLLGCPREHLDFPLWYLREKSTLGRTDSGKYSITVVGVDMLEKMGREKKATPEAERLLPAPGQSPS